MPVPHPNPAPACPAPPPAGDPSPSDRDRSLLTALFDPSSDLIAAAEAVGLSHLDLAHWLAEPAIQTQVEQMQSLRALRREIWADQLRREAAEALRDVMKSVSDVAERRRCANAVLRATSAPRAPRREAPDARPTPPPTDTPPAPSIAIAHDAHDMAPALYTPPDADPGVHPDDRHPAPAESRLEAAITALRACGYDIPDPDQLDRELDQLDELEDEELDRLEDEALDRELDALADGDPADDDDEDHDDDHDDDPTADPDDFAQLDPLAEAPSLDATYQSAAPAHHPAPDTS